MDIIVYTHFEVIIITLLIGYMKNIYKLINAILFSYHNKLFYKNYILISELSK